MVLYKLHDFDADYREAFDGEDVKGLDVYSTVDDDKIGTVSDALVDESGKFRYLIIDTGFWVFGKKVLLPIGRSRVDYSDRRVYADLTKEQAEALPNANDLEKIDYEHEEGVRGVYRSGTASTSTASTAGLGSAVGATGAAATGYDRETYDYDRHDTDLYRTNDRDHQTLKLYEERLVANKKRAKTGEVDISKRVETETARVSVPVDRERVVIERSTPGTAIPADNTAFQGGEVARVEVYEETPDIHKEAFVREEVKVKKVIEHETVEAQEQLRREQLDVDTQGQPRVNDR